MIYMACIYGIYGKYISYMHNFYNLLYWIFGILKKRRFMTHVIIE
jgi:hypothetical protein